MEQAHHWEAHAFHLSYHDQVLALEEVWVRRVDLQHQTEEEWQLAWDSFEALRQLQASTDMAIKPPAPSLQLPPA